jgi:polysaccharide export outer membrane protein
MQPARLGAVSWCFATGALLGMLVLPPPSRAQAVLETPSQTNDRIKSLSASIARMPHDYVIGNGDLISVEVFDVKELTRDVRVSQMGSIAIPLLPVRLHIAGLTETQAEQKIAEVLEAHGLVSHPEVSVTVRERRSKPITVVGAVGHPMVFQADRQISLLELLAEAGGIATDASDVVIVTRPAQEQPLDPSEPPAVGSPTSASESAEKETLASLHDPLPPSNTITVNLYDLMEKGDTANNILLQSGDVVTVPHAGIVYVMGAVGRPGGFVLTNDRSQMSMLRLLALAGGLTRTAKSDHATVVRKDSQGKQQEVPVDINRILKFQAEDIILQPSDILVVPDSASKKALIRIAELGIAMGTGAALYRVTYR